MRRNGAGTAGPGGCWDDGPDGGCPAVCRGLSGRLRAGRDLRVSGPAAEETGLARGSDFSGGSYVVLGVSELCGVRRRYPGRVVRRSGSGGGDPPLGCGLPASGGLCGVLGRDRHAFGTYFWFFAKKYEKNMEFTKKIICIWKKIGYNKVE